MALYPAVTFEGDPTGSSPLSTGSFDGLGMLFEAEGLVSKGGPSDDINRDGSLAPRTAPPRGTDE